MKTLTKLFGAVLLFALNCHAQIAITNGGFRVKFASAEWSQEQPPPALRDPIAKGGGKLLLYAESPRGKFFVSRFDFPAGASQVGFVAGFINGVRNSTTKTGAKIDETFGSFRNTDFPTYTFDRNVQDSFIHSDAIFCVDKLYNIQVVGLQSARADLLKTLDGVAIKDAPMARATFNKAQEPNALARNVAYEMGRRVGFLGGIIVVPVIIVLLLVWAFGGFGRKNKPPPLPPSARANP